MILNRDTNPTLGEFRAQAGSQSFTEKMTEGG